MLDPKRHDLPEVVMSMVEVLEESMAQHRAPSPKIAARQLASQIIRHWGGIQAYIAPPDSKVTPRFIEEARIWAAECLAALGADEEQASLMACKVAADLRAHLAGVVLYLPKDRWSFRADLSKRFNGHNQVDLCREYGLTSASLYKMIGEERDSLRGNVG